MGHQLLLILLELDYGLLDPEKTPPQADIAHTVPLSTGSCFLDSSETNSEDGVRYSRHDQRTHRYVRSA